MLESLIGFLTTTIPTIFVGWSIPIVYICLCLISGYARRRREAKIPDRIEPRPCVPSLHPVMLSALQFHGETASQNYSNTLCAALAGIVHLIGRGKVACTETVPPPEDEAPSPFVERRRRRAGMTARDEVARAFGADVLLARRDAVDRGPTLTPEGASILSDGLATVAWGETLSRMGAEPLVDAPPMADVPDLLATLLAMGHPGLAADLAGRVELSLSQKETPPGSPRDTSRAKAAVLFCARRTRSVHGDVKMRTSPACLIFDDLERHCSSMSS